MTQEVNDIEILEQRVSEHSTISKETPRPNFDEMIGPSMSSKSTSQVTPTIKDLMSLPTSGKKVLLIGDSNLDPIEPHKLHRNRTCIKSRRYTIQEASENVMNCDKAEDVTDIVFNVGLNDMRRGLEPSEIRPKIFAMQSAYGKKFQKARLHLCAMPPISPQTINGNSKLQEIARDTGCNFISVRDMSNTISRTIQPKYIDGIHYTQAGISIMARNIKRSLHSGANLPTSMA